MNFTRMFISMTQFTYCISSIIISLVVGYIGGLFVGIIANHLNIGNANLYVFIATIFYSFTYLFLQIHKMVMIAKMSATVNDEQIDKIEKVLKKIEKRGN